jgi:eukaryotic-like serine/threonine-protein kinase
VAVETGVLPARYTGVRRIGHGGMGEIYVAEDGELGRKVAIKVLGDRFAGDEGLRKRFRREALTAARLSGHPNIVTIYDVGQWEGHPFLVMEYLPGGTIADRARAGSVPQNQAIRWLGEAAAGLDAAHELGIVHRDVKPANLLLDSRRSVVVADFGIARVVDDSTGGMTAAGTILGTAGYLAPEQALGDKATPASDRYALGIVAYELMTGGRPFERSSATAEAAAHINEPVPPASERGVGLPRAVDAVFAKALAKDPDDRYRTSAAFVDALDDALRAEPEPTRELPVVPLPPHPDPGRGDPVPSRRRPSPLVPLLLAGLLLSAVGGVAAAVFMTDGDDPPATTVQRQVTVTKQVATTLPGEVVTHTQVTTVVPPSTQTTSPATGPISVEEAVQLTDQSTYALGRGDWNAAAALARRAYPALRGTFSDGFRYEAYVNYDRGRALAELGRCQQALTYLDRSEELQGHREEIDEARARCDEGG